jgi:hypothetical protein
VQEVFCLLFRIALIVVDFLVSSIFSYTPTLRMKIHRPDWGLELTSKTPDPRPKRLEPRSSGQTLKTSVNFY